MNQHDVKGHAQLQALMRRAAARRREPDVAHAVPRLLRAARPAARPARRHAARRHHPLAGRRGAGPGQQHPRRAGVLGHDAGLDPPRRRDAGGPSHGAPRLDARHLRGAAADRERLRSTCRRARCRLHGSGRTFVEQYRVSRRAAAARLGLQRRCSRRARFRRPQPGRSCSGVHVGAPGSAIRPEGEVLVTSTTHLDRRVRAWVHASGDIGPTSAGTSIMQTARTRPEVRRHVETAWRPAVRATHLPEGEVRERRPIQPSAIVSRGSSTARPATTARAPLRQPSLKRSSSSPSRSATRPTARRADVPPSATGRPHRRVAFEPAPGMARDPTGSAPRWRHAIVRTTYRSSLSSRTRRA